MQVAWSDSKLTYITESCRGKSVLDIGCVQHGADRFGSAYWLHRAINAVASELVGVDILEKEISMLRGMGYSVLRADASAFNIGRRFDVIVAGDVIEHLGNHDGFFSTCRAHLKSRGNLIVSTPNPWYWRNVVKAAVFREVPNNPEHTCWLCPRTLRQLASRHSFCVTHIQFTSRYLPTDLCRCQVG